MIKLIWNKTLDDQLPELNHVPEGLYKSSAGRRKWQPIPVFLPGESRGLRSLVGCHLWCRHTQSRNDWSALAAAATEQVILRGWWCSSGPERELGLLSLKYRPQLWGLGFALLDLSPPPEVWPIYPYLHQLRHKRLPVQRRVLELKATLLLVCPQATSTMEEQQAQTRDSRIICAFQLTVLWGSECQPPGTQLWYLPGLKTQTTALQSSFHL